MQTLNTGELNLVKEILVEKSPNTLPALGDIHQLSYDVIEKLQQDLLDVFLPKGLKDDDEPNQDGETIEQLIYKLNSMKV